MSSTPKSWKSLDSSDRLSILVLGVCVVVIVALVLFR